MRFYTMAWWRGCQTGDAGDPSADYAAHFESVRGRLPPGVLSAEAAPLHDARLRELKLTPADGSLSLVFDTLASNERLALTYDGIERFEASADPEVGLGGPAGYGDLGYTEVDDLSDGLFEHRFLFSSGIEFVVVFRGLDFTRTTRVT